MDVTAPRRIIENAVRSELFGPLDSSAPIGRPIDCSSESLSFEHAEDSRGQFHDSATGQEILTQSDPLHRYGIGVLHPSVLSPRTAAEPIEDSDLSGTDGLPTVSEDPDGPSAEFIAESRSIPAGSADTDDFDLKDSNRFKPSAMAISFRVRVGGVGTLRISASAAYYRRLDVYLADIDRTSDWWLRVPITVTGSLASGDMRGDAAALVTIPLESNESESARRLRATAWIRPIPGGNDPNSRLVTVALTNALSKRGAAHALFQVRMDVRCEGGLAIEPYPRSTLSERDDEEQSLDLLYRNKLTFAIGHGCAATWGQDDQTPRAAQWVATDALPAYEATSLTPTVYEIDDDGRRHPVEISMRALAAGDQLGEDQIAKLLDLYRAWIEARESEIDELPNSMRLAAQRHVGQCRVALQRMRDGWSLVHSDPIAGQAFRWANEAMLEQQLRSQFGKLKRPVVFGSDGTMSIEAPHPDATLVEGRGMWRPFQIAFVLATLPDLVDPSRKNRTTVDLIFFPTGGGKTEAYLGVAAVSLLLRRLRNPRDTGTDTIMRYTLRLLTAQQFLRAAALVCVLEDLRSRNVDSLGSDRFGIGIWLGGTTTPNTWKQAKTALRKLQRDAREQNLFLLLSCPWCGAQMGPVRNGRKSYTPGYEEVGTKVVLCCIDPQCRFSRPTDPLPIHVVDEDVYACRPSIVIGTVDKFAMLAWRPEARRLFGLGETGAREVSPPTLILQDELHLISGPLGSMAGLYEPIIDDLCTDHRSGSAVAPKIIASTATIRRYREQILGIFGRGDVELFPPHGLTESESFFAAPATLDDGSKEPGRKYLGVMSASLGSTQTVQVRVLSAVLQAATTIPEDARDGYWTNLNFFNSLRELGNTVSLIQSDVPDYLTGLRRRDGITPRWPSRYMELTSRRRSDEIPKAIERLESAFGNRDCLDLCLASNIIEVGVDIDRLALMTIVGQPKTTAQYVQVSGRIGRRPQVSPGLVITIYGAAKPRDRSHYEHFRTYHQQLYAEVEPTSVTPFATPVLRRALHAAIVAGIRQRDPAAQPHPFPAAQFGAIAQLLKVRAESVDPHEGEVLERLIAVRRREWDSWERTQWDANTRGGDPKQGLMRYAGALPDLGATATMWDVPTSMRNVDAECQLQITTAYLTEDGAAVSDK